MKGLAAVLLLALVVSCVVENSDGQNLRWGKRDDLKTEFKEWLKRAFLEENYAREHEHASKCKEKLFEIN